MSDLDHQEDLYQVALLIDQLKHEDSNLRLHAVSCLPRIAKALGPDRTRSELLPFLTDSTDDEDDIMITLAEKLGEIASLVGGQEHMHLLISPLEILLSAEDSYVRDAALKTLESLINQCKSKELKKYVLTSFLKLATRDWHTSRMSAATMFLFINRNRWDEEMTARTTFFTLCDDDSALVRRAAILVISDIVKTVTTQEVCVEIYPIFKRVATDEQDNVRIQVINLAIAMSNILPSDFKMSQILPVFLSLSGDRSWRVRWSFCNKLVEICQSFDADVSTKNFGTVYESLLADVEVEVRAAAASVIAAVSKYLNKSIILNKIIPSIRNLITDPSEHVRVSLASSVNAISFLLDKSEVIDNLLPLLLLLLRDDAAEVRLNVISTLESINSVIGVDMLSQALLPSIIDLSEDSKWRVRLAIIDLIPRLAKQLGNEFFNDKLHGLCIAWLSDNVYSVRKAACNNLCQLVRHFGESWAKEYMLPRLEKMLSHINYLYRMTALHCLQELMDILSTKTIEEIILPLIRPCASDSVANVRFTFAKCVSSLPIGKISKKYSQDYLILLHQLLNDTDSDVKHYGKMILDFDKMLTDLIIINKSGGVIFSRHLSNQGSHLSDNDYLRLGSTFHSLHAIATQVAPTLSTGIEIIESDTLKLYSLASKTGIKIALTATLPLLEVDSLLQGLYEVYADYVLKNPFYEIDMPIRSEGFNQAVERIVAKFVAFLTKRSR